MDQGEFEILGGRPAVRADVVLRRALSFEPLGGNMGLPQTLIFSCYSCRDRRFRASEVRILLGAPLPNEQISTGTAHAYARAHYAL